MLTASEEEVPPACRRLFRARRRFRSCRRRRLLLVVGFLESPLPPVRTMLVAAVSLLLTLAAVGMAAGLALSRPPAGAGFWRLMQLLIVAFLSLGIGLRWTTSAAAVSLPPIGALVAYLLCLAASAAVGVRAAVQPVHEDRLAAGMLIAAAGAGGVALLLDPATVPAAPLPHLGEALYISGIVSIALTVGPVLLAMVLAHWYLVEPRMPLSPLRRVLTLFAAAEVLRLGQLAGVVAFHWEAWTTQPGGLLHAFTLGNALFVAVRGALGIVAPLALAWMTWKTVEIRSIQSATGILYAGVVLVLFGEVIALFLTLSTGLPH